MKKTLCTLLLGASLALAPKANAWTIPWLWEHPRDGVFKIYTGEKGKELFLNCDPIINFKNNNFQHFVASMGATMAFDSYFDEHHNKYGWLYSIGIVLGCGLAKEIEDGYREGMSFNDLLANAIGCGVGHFTYYWLKGIL